MAVLPGRGGGGGRDGWEGWERLYERYPLTSEKAPMTDQGYSSTQVECGGISEFFGLLYMLCDILIAF